MLNNDSVRQRHSIAMHDVLPCDFDTHDVAILSALIENPRLTAVELAEEVHLSRPAVSRRLVSLADRGFLRSTLAMKTYSEFGFHVRARVEMSTANRVGASITEWLLDRPEVLSISIVTGDSLMTMDVIAVDMEHLHRFVRLLQKFGETSTQVVFSTVFSQLTLVERIKRAKQFLREEAHERN